MASCGSPETTAAAVFFEPTVKFAENGCSGFFLYFCKTLTPKWQKTQQWALNQGIDNKAVSIFNVFFLFTSSTFRENLFFSTRNEHKKG